MNPTIQTMMDSPAVFTLGVDVRARFLQRTYAHLLGAIVGFVLIEWALFASGAAEGVARTLMSLPGGWFTVLAGFMVVSWIASRMAHTAASPPAQYAALTGFVVAEALIFVPMLYIAAEHYPGVIASAAGVTLVGFTGLTAVVFITRKDFSFMRSMLMWGGGCALLAIGTSLIFGFTLGPLFSVAMIAFAGGAILHDTSNVLHHYPEDRYVAASLELFASVALLFWYVLRLFLSARD